VFFFDKSVSLDSTSDYNILGRAIVIHADADDLGKGSGPASAGSKLTGNAGARIACCKIT
jgi:Cu-Zn family superoxide dismutase